MAGSKNTYGHSCFGRMVQIPQCSYHFPKRHMRGLLQSSVWSLEKVLVPCKFQSTEQQLWQTRQEHCECSRQTFLVLIMLQCKWSVTYWEPLRRFRLVYICICKPHWSGTCAQNTQVCAASHPHSFQQSRQSRHQRRPTELFLVTQRLKKFDLAVQIYKGSFLVTDNLHS